MERVKALILNGSPRRGGGTSAASRLLESDIIVLASPVYVDAMSGLMKTAMDRLAWLRQTEASLDLDWWASRGLLERGRAWLTPSARAFPPSLILARCASSIIALGMWGPRRARRGPARGS